MLPLVLILASLGELDRRAPDGPLAHPAGCSRSPTLSPLQLLLAHVPGRLAGVAGAVGAHDALLLPLRAALVVAWQVAGWWTVVRLPATRARGGRRGASDRVNAAIALADGLELRIADEPRARRAHRPPGLPDAAAAAGASAARRRRAISPRRASASACPILKRGVQTVFPGGMELTVARGRPGLAGDRRRTAWTSSSAWPARAEAPCGRGSVYAAKDSLAAVHRRVPALRRPLTATVRPRCAAGSAGGRPTSRPGLRRDRAGDVHRATASDGVVAVAADLTGVPAGDVTEVVLMNELGARALRPLRGLRPAPSLAGAAVGTWDEVDAATASLRQLAAHGVAFTLARVHGARLLPRPGARRRAASRGPGSATRCARRRPRSPTTVRVERARTAVSSVLLVYPFFRRSLDRSRFRFPPLGRRLRGRRACRRPGTTCGCSTAPS